MIRAHNSDEIASLLSVQWDWVGRCLEWAKVEREWKDQIESVCDGIVVKKVSYTTGFPSSCQYESHKREVDLQYIIRGGERIDLSRRECVPIDVEYDSESDLVLYKSEGATGERLVMAEGDFAVFFPEDVHQCGWSDGVNEEVYKYVFKIDLAKVICKK